MFPYSFSQRSGSVVALVNSTALKLGTTNSTKFENSPFCVGEVETINVSLIYPGLQLIRHHLGRAHHIADSTP
jgi:hypothetical protein